MNDCSFVEPISVCVDRMFGVDRRLDAVHMLVDVKLSIQKKQKKDCSFDNKHFLGFCFACLPLFIHIPIVDHLPVIDYIPLILEWYRFHSISLLSFNSG